MTRDTILVGTVMNAHLLDHPTRLGFARALSRGRARDLGFRMRP